MFSPEAGIDKKIYKRREVVFLILSGVFLGSLTMLNILGISKFLDLSFSISGMHIPFKLAIGVLAYPITFLCTDFISELYGKRRANTLVWVGLILNFWVLFILWLGGALPPVPEMDAATGLPVPTDQGYVFYAIQKLTFGATIASMIAYLTAQFVDVHIFHFLKKLTKGKHLWLRNNGSTLISQMVDSTAVILITHYYANALPISEEESLMPQLVVFILSGYVFKLVTALLDTVPFYFGTYFFYKYLHIEPLKEIE